MDPFLIFLAVVIVLFVIGREFTCWYFKINHLLSTLRSIEVQMKLANQMQLNAEEKQILKQAQEQLEREAKYLVDT